MGGGMEEDDARAALDALIRQRGGNYGALSRLIGRNPAYIQQYIKRGTPRKLDEEDRRILAHYFGVEEDVLGGPSARRASGQVLQSPDRGKAPHVPHKTIGQSMAVVPRLSLGASAGLGSLDEDERASGVIAFDPAWLRTNGLKAASLSIVHVDGDSMAPTLSDGDDIMVNHDDGAARLRDGVYVLRFDDGLMVKRIALAPRVQVGGRGGWMLTVSSDNPHYPSWVDVDPALVDIVGRVVWASRRLL
jgi:phage repressor protein C with HTH and peptisase S24 domain